MSLFQSSFFLLASRGHNNREEAAPQFCATDPQSVAAAISFFLFFSIFLHSLLLGSNFHVPGFRFLLLFYFKSKMHFHFFFPPCKTRSFTLLYVIAYGKEGFGSKTLLSHFYFLPFSLSNLSRGGSTHTTPVGYFFFWLGRNR